MTLTMTPEEISKLKQKPKLISGDGHPKLANYIQNETPVIIHTIAGNSIGGIITDEDEGWIWVRSTKGAAEKDGKEVHVIMNSSIKIEHVASIGEMIMKDAASGQEQVMGIDDHNWMADEEEKAIRRQQAGAKILGV